MAFLYISNNGFVQHRHSYSAGLLYDKSPFAFSLKYVHGWKEKDNKANLLFGRALEESIQFYHDHNGEGAVEDFKRRWNESKGKDIRYTEVEKDWQNLLQIGTEMLQLYIIKQPSLPIPLGSRIAFQREYLKEVFPNDPNYGGIESVGKLDIICYNESDHPMLPKSSINECAPIRPLIVDIKTSQDDFPDNPGYAAFDKQLRHYSWLSGISDVSLLWFKKVGQGFKKGYSCTVLVGRNDFKPGDEAVVAKISENVVWVFRNDFMLQEMDRAQGFKNERLDTTKAAKQRAEEWLKQWGTGFRIEEITKQRLQFNCGYVTPESAKEAGEVAARQIVSIVNSYKNNSWPNNFGIRYPTDDRHDPYFRAFILKDEAFKREYFIQSRKEESLEDIF